MTAKTHGRLLFLRFAEFDTAFVDALAHHFEYLERRQPQLTDLQPVNHLGKGAFGSVTMVKHKLDGSKYALKKIRKVDANVCDVVTMECTLLRQARHAFVVDLEATIETDAHICIVTELLGGGDLFEMMRIKRRFTQEEARFIAGSIVVALEVLHRRNIVHRDLKPENVMFDISGNIRLIDLGAAKDISKHGKTCTVIGTPMYMAPEIFKKHGYDTRVYFWSLGVLLYDLVCACLPFGMKCGQENIQNVKAARKAVLTFPAQYQDNVGQNLVQGLLTRDPNKRLSCGEIRNHGFFETRGPGNFFESLIQWEIESPFKCKIEKPAELEACLTDCSTDVSQLTEQMWSSAHSSEV